CVVAVALGIARATFPVGTEVAMALLGVGFLCAYLSQIDTSDGIGYIVAFVLGAVGAGVLLLAFGWAAFPTVLHEGPRILRTANGEFAPWVLAGRLAIIAVTLAFAFATVIEALPNWRRYLGIVLFASAIVLLVNDAAHRITTISMSVILVRSIAGSVF